MSNDNEFNPQSTDAMFATILANQERDRAERADFRAEMRETLQTHSRRIGYLERFTSNLRGKVAVVSSIAGGIGAALLAWGKDLLGIGGGN